MVAHMLVQIPLLAIAGALGATGASSVAQERASARWNTSGMSGIVAGADRELLVDGAAGARLGARIAG